MTMKKLTDYLKQQTPTQSSSKIEQVKTVPTRILFKKETEFQDTPIGKIPREWTIATLSQLIAYEKGKRPNKLYKEKTRHDLIPYLKAEYLRGLEPPEWCEPTDANVLKVSKNDIIMIWDGSYSGEVFTGFEGALASTMIKIKPLNTKLVSKYLYYWLRKYYNVIHSTTVGTGVPHVNRRVFENLLIPIPSQPEQEGIAEFLSVIDSAIEKVRLLIDRAERLKKGLMQELLTKGIGHKEYKETPIGKIPREWSIVRLNEIATIIMGQSPPSDTYNDYGEGLPFLQGKEEFGLIHPTPRLYTTRPTKIAEPGDILIAVRAPVGDVNIAPFRLCIGRGLAALRFNKNSKAHYLFYFYYLQHIKPRIESLGKGTTFKAITKEDLENLLVPVPSLEEQVRISEVLYELDRYLLLLKGRQARLERVRKGLMETLLTGRVRVIAEPS